MQVNVRFYGFVRDIANASLAVELPGGSTLRDLFDEIGRRSGQTLRDRLFTKSGDLETNVLVFVGANQIDSLDQPVAEGQEASQVKIFVVSATAGG